MSHKSEQGANFTGLHGQVGTIITEFDSEMTTDFDVEIITDFACRNSFPNASLPGYQICSRKDQKNPRRHRPLTGDTAC